LNLFLNVLDFQSNPSPSRWATTGSSLKKNEQGYRKINFIESGYTYDRSGNPDRVLSPYMNGKKNSLFLNPSLYTSDELKKSSEIKAKITPYGTALTSQEMNTARKLNFGDKPIQPQPQPEQRVHTEGAKPTREETVPVHVVKTEPRENEMKLPDGTISNVFLPQTPEQPNGKNKDITPTKVDKTSQQDKTPLSKKSNAKSGDSTPQNEFINVCEGCFNKGLMTEQKERERMQRLMELELERQALNYDHYLYRTQLTQEKNRKDALKRISDENHAMMTVKKDRFGRRGDDELSPSEIKPHSPEKRGTVDGTAHNLLDNIFESSEKYNQERQVIQFLSFLIPLDFLDQE